jgi:hypothetical protein
MRNLSTTTSYSECCYLYSIFFICLFSYYRLQKEYCDFNTDIGQTGAGLQYKDMEEGSTLKNLVGE